MTETPDNPVLQIYEETLAKLLTLARARLNNPEFGSDIHALAAQRSIPGVSVELEKELLHVARAVARRRKPKDVIDAMQRHT